MRFHPYGRATGPWELKTLLDGINERNGIFQQLRQGPAGLSRFCALRTGQPKAQYGQRSIARPAPHISHPRAEAANQFLCTPLKGVWAVRVKSHLKRLFTSLVENGS